MIPRVVIAGTHSGAGKTTLAAGLMAALRERGLRVQGFKAGPDYVDPRCHHWATGRPGRNLDTWMMTPAQVLGAFARGACGADLAVIEGVMGLYDGARGGGELGSTAHLAKVLQAPVVLVVDARASARSLAAVALGFKLLDQKVSVAGVICNRVAGQGHVGMLREALDGIGLPLLGAVGRDPDLEIPEGRLGLLLPGGTDTRPGWIRRGAEAVSRQVDLERLLDLARAADKPPAALAERPQVMLPRLAGADRDDPFASEKAGAYGGLRVGVALDRAFWFYYEDTFDLLRHWGVEPIPFSPTGDRELPAVHGLYLGGGFPERHAETLAANTAMRAAVRAACAGGMPVLAEGGGYLYLLGALAGEDGRLFAMAGCLPGTALLCDRLQGMGYRVATPGAVKGHVFHYSRAEATSEPTGRPAWQLWRADGSFDRADGCRRGSLLASYLHVHHGTEPRVMAQFLHKCREYKEVVLNEP